MRGLTATRLLPWALRAAWISLPLAAGPALADALHTASGPVRTVASAGLWAGWAVGLLAVLVAQPVALTALRVLAPAGVAAAGLAAAAGHASVAALASTAVALALAFAPPIAEVAVNGPAYPNERRYPLRTPGPLLVGPLPLAWAMAVSGIAAGPLLLAARQWVTGGIAVAAGWPLALILLRSLHSLARRWLVFVPAGMVVHDLLVLVDPVLFRRADIAAVGPAPADPGDALDLTERALGLALLVRLHEPAELARSRPGKPAGETVSADALLVSPTRPGRVLAEAAGRRIAVG